MINPFRDDDDNLDDFWEDDMTDWFDRLVDRIGYLFSRVRDIVAGWFGG